MSQTPIECDLQRRGWGCKPTECVWKTTIAQNRPSQAKTYLGVGVEERISTTCEHDLGPECREGKQMYQEHHSQDTKSA